VPGESGGDRHAVVVGMQIDDVVL
ncbi:uncharacterized protein METZ01_LOCUS181362, partial [marine metagenome]